MKYPVDKALNSARLHYRLRYCGFYPTEKYLCHVRAEHSQSCLYRASHPGGVGDVPVVKVHQAIDLDIMAAAIVQASIGVYFDNATVVCIYTIYHMSNVPASHMYSRIIVVG